MIDACRNGDYRLIGLRQLRPAVARIEYEPFGTPYGGTACMVALVEAFGFRVSQIQD